MYVDFARFPRTSWFRFVAEILIFTLVTQNFPIGLLRVGEARADALTSTSVLWVDRAGACGGQGPCFTSIQAAIDVVQPGQTVRVMAGQYREQLRIVGKNEGALAVEGNRITIEADPAAGVGDVVLHGTPNKCQGGRAITFQRSSFVTVRGFRIENAGRRGIVLRGGSGGGTANHLERNWLHVGSNRECLGGIDVGRGNADTIVANNVLSGLRRQAIRFRGKSGRAYVVGNTLVRNESNAIFLARGAQVSLWNNVIVRNGVRRDGRGGKRHGIRFVRTPHPSGDPEVDLRNNLICGNARGEIKGPTLGAGDTGNVTPTGSEGPSVVANPDCADLAKVFFDLDGPDDQLDSVDDDFALAGTSPAADTGLDPRAQGASVANEVFEADYLAPGVRPGGPEFDMGAVEITGPRPTRTATPSPTPTLSPTPSATPSPTPTVTVAPTPSRTATPTVTVTATATTTATRTATPTTTATASGNAATATRTATPAGPIATATRTATPGGPVATTTPTRTATAVRTATATPTVTATPTATAHVFPQNDHYEIVLGQTLTVPAPGVLGNDLDQLGHQLSANKLSDPDKGSLDAFGSDGGFTFTAPPTYPNPPLQPAVRLHIGGSTMYPTVHRLVDITGDGNPDIISHSPNRDFLAFDGVTGAQLWHTNGFPPPPDTDCAVDTVANGMAVGDLDDDGDPEFVQSLRCQRDGDGVGGRFAIFDARTGLVERITDNVWEDSVGVGGSITLDTLPTIARLAPGESPSILVGLAATGNGGDCSRYVAGAPGPGTYCRVVMVLDGATGHVRRKMFATGSGPYSAFDGSSRRWPPPIVFDLDGDGVVEIIYAGAVFHPDGTVLWEYPLGVIRTAIANLDDTPDAEVVMVTTQINTHLDGIHVFKSNGEELWSFPLTDTNIVGHVAIADVDRDGLPDILVSLYDYGTGSDVLFVLDREGQVKWLKQIPNTNSTNKNRPAVYDLDGDGVPEVIWQTQFALSFLDGTNGATEFRYDFAEGEAFENTMPAVADLDGDGHAEVLIGRPVSAIGYTSAGLWVFEGQNHDWRPVQGGNNQISYYGANISDDGTIPYPQKNVFANQRTNVYGTQAPYPYLPTFVGRDQTSFLYEATDGSQAAPAQVSIDILPTNRPPQFTTTAPTVYQPEAPFTYAAHAADPDPGDPITYSLLVVAADYFPPRCDIDHTSGVFSCSSIGRGFAFPDAQTFVLAATDSHGAIATQVVRLVPSSGNGIVPNVVGMQRTAAENAITAAGFLVGAEISFQSPFPAGQVVTQAPVGGKNAQLSSAIRLGISLGPPPNPRDVDDDGDGYTENQGDCDDGNSARNPGAADSAGNAVDENCDGIDGVLPIASIAVTPANDVIVTGDDLQYTATATLTDGTSADVTAIVVWQSSTGAASISTTGVAHGLAVGTTTISATRGAIAGSTSLGVFARALDQTDPTAIITSPAAGSEVTQPIDVIGTADDAAFLKYELAYAPAGSDEFTVIATSTSAVTNGVLGQLDPTMLVNDLYDLRLRVFDRADNEAETLVTVSVTRDMKVGNFSLTFTDLSVPVSGIPIVVNRTYDSRDKGKGDFGVGWRLGIQTMRIRANREQGSGWVVAHPGPLAWSLVEVGQHVVSLTLPGGKVEQFDLKVTPTSSTFQPFSTGLIASYVPRPGTLGTLQLLDNANLAIIDDQTDPVTTVTLMDDVTFNTFDPRHFRYVTPDGKTVDLGPTTGVERIEDTNGNALTIGPAGITHSSGKSVVFARDAEGRVTQITDPEGHTQSYVYDARGDLVSATDQGGNVTTFSYDARHGLLKIVDPLGRTMGRNEYDDDGRLIASTSANGRRITYGHDLGTKQEVLTDDDGSITVLEYDDAGRVVRLTDALGGVTAHTYDAVGNQLTTTDPLGHTVTRTFDAARNVTSQTDALGNTTSYTHDARGALLTRTDPLGHVQAFTYDADGNNLTQTNGAGIVDQTNTYDANGLLATRTDGTGATTQFFHDASGFETARIDPRGHQSEMTFDAVGNPLTEKDRRGQTITTTYDARGLFTKKRDQSGNESTFTYDALGTITSVTNALGHSAGRTLDAQGREIATVNAVGETVTRAYDVMGRLIDITDALGRATHYDYDALGRRTKITYSDGAFETLVYDAAGNNTSRTDANGHTTTFAYDDANRLISTTDALGGVTLYEHDGVGNLVKQTDALGHEQTFVYDAANRRTGATLPNGSTTTTAYDGAGRPTIVTDAAGHATTTAYDGNGNVITVTDAAGGVTTFTYDAENNLLTQTDANGHTTTFTYDANGRRTSATLPGGEAEAYEYDQAGNVTKTTTRNGDALIDEFDAAQRKTARIYPGGGRIDFTYTATGKVATATDARGATLYTYDSRDRVGAIENPDGSSIAYGYDAAGNRTSVTTRTGIGEPDHTTTYTYDALNRMASVTDPNGRVSTYGYDAIGNLTSVQYANGTATTYAYDAASQLSVLEYKRGATVLDRFTYSVNAVGDRTRVDALDASFVVYEYDVLRRLTRETRHDTGSAVVYDVVYTYDAVGNRLSRTLNGGAAIAYTYDVDDRLLSRGSVTFGYDANGNTTSRTAGGPSATYGYDYENRLVTTTDSGGATTTYQYDAFGERVRKDRTTGAVNFLVDSSNATGASQVAAEYADGGSPLASYVYGTQLVSQERGADLSYYHRDGGQSVRALTDENGTVTDRYEFDAFGETLAASGGTENAYRFAGEQLDPELGLYYLRARYYSPETGRFFSVDPFAGEQRDPVSLHRYLYARVNPVSFVDPSGREGEPSSLSEVMIVNALIGITLGAVADVVLCGAVGKCKTGGELVASIFFNGVFGAFGGWAGTFAAKGAAFTLQVGDAAVTAFATESGLQLFRLLVSKGGVMLFISGAKAMAATVNTVLQAYAESVGRPAFGAKPGDWPPSVGVLTALFVVNWAAEAFYLNGSQAQILLGSARRVFKGSPQEQFVEELVKQDGTTKFGENLLRDLEALTAADRNAIIDDLIDQTFSKIGFRFTGGTELAKMMETLESYIIACAGSLTQFADGVTAP